MQDPNELGEWIDGFLSKPKLPTRRETYKEPQARFLPPAQPAPPSVADALVLFTKQTTCACGQQTVAPMFVGLRRRIRSGHSYLAYDSTMAPIAATLPRLVIATEERVNWCPACFGGTPTSDDLPRELHGISHVHPMDDLNVFLKHADVVAREERDVSESNQPEA